ncbi:MAG TPA: transposase family protein, partial [Rhodopila sp.]|nr:transposase family protein [Rhodopila sp.]
MPISQQGSVNTTSLVVPDLYVQIVPPQNLILNGVPTNIIGVVGTASWGPVNEPTVVGTMAEYASAFGAIIPRKYDMGTQIATAVQQGAQNFRCLRVTDGTDTAAYTLVPGTNAGFTALYTGSLGNNISISLAVGSKPNTWRLSVLLPGFAPEIYDGLTGTGADFWAGMATAVNSGLGPSRGPSRLVVVSAGGTTASPAVFALTLGTTGPGTDGVSQVGVNTLIGVDGSVRSGMYALRGQRCGLAVLADCDDSTTWTSQSAFGLQEGIYMILTGPASDTIQNAVATKSQAGLDSYAAKLMFGDWLFWSDQVNNTIRLVQGTRTWKVLDVPRITLARFVPDRFYPAAHPPCEAAMDSFSTCWDELEDPRTGNAQLHDFHDLLMIALCTVLCGGQTATDMALFARAKETYLRGFLKLPAGLPSHDTFSRLFRLLDPVKFSAWFQRFTAAFGAQLRGVI